MAETEARTAGNTTVRKCSLPYSMMVDKGVGYVPRDRHGRGIVPQMSVAENVMLGHESTTRFGALDVGSARERVQEISDISRSLKALAKELRVPVVALSQLSRDVEKREDKRPQLADFRDSSAIEQDADVVCFMYREEYYLSWEEPRQKGEERNEAFLERHAGWKNRLRDVANIAEMIIAKQRMGPVGVEVLSFSPELTRFTDL